MNLHSGRQAAVSKNQLEKDALFLLFPSVLWRPRLCDSSTILTLCWKDFLQLSIMLQSSQHRWL